MNGEEPVSASRGSTDVHIRVEALVANTSSNRKNFKKGIYLLENLIVIEVNQVKVRLKSG